MLNTDNKITIISAILAFISTIIAAIIITKGSHVEPLKPKEVQSQNIPLVLLDDVEKRIQQLKNLLEQGNENWRGIRFPSRHVVKDLEGYYYVIDIRDAYTGEIMQFKTGEYTIDDFDKKFRDSLANFTDLILRELIPQNIKYRIFIKGSADILGHNTFRGKFEPLYVFNDVEAYQRVSGLEKYRYIQKYITCHISEPFKNGDLPNLRARFIQLKLAEVYPELQGASILDGDVDPQLGQEYRNAMLLLFVDWPEK